jgi:PUA domain protein
MCPGLTSKGGDISLEAPKNAFVVRRARCRAHGAAGLGHVLAQAIMAEGKENALAIGQLKMSTAEIRKINKDIGIDLVHFIGDGLYRYRVD